MGSLNKKQRTVQAARALSKDVAGERSIVGADNELKGAERKAREGGQAAVKREKGEAQQFREASNSEESGTTEALSRLCLRAMRNKTGAKPEATNAAEKHLAPWPNG